jgi:hypothetical protein
MKIFYKAMVIVVAFLVFVYLLNLGFEKWTRKIPPSFFSEASKKFERAEDEREERAIKLVKERFWDEIRPAMERKQGYVKHIGWEAYRLPSKVLLGVETLAESTYIVSYTYTTLHLMEQNMVEGWWWEVVLGDNTVRSIDETEYLREKALADSMQKKIKFDPLKYGTPEKEDTSK